MLKRGEGGFGAAAGVGLLLCQAIALTAGVPVAATPDAIPDATLGCAESFAVLSASGVSNTGRSYIYGDLGVNAGAFVGGFPPGEVFEGSIYRGGGPLVRRAQRDTVAAYNLLVQLPSFSIPSRLEGNLGGLRLSPGVYAVGTSARLNGTLLLDAQDEDRAVFVFRVGATLTTAQDASVVLVNRGHADTVYWVVGGSAKLAKNTSFEGNILARQDIVMGSGARIRCGRALTLAGAVTLNRNYIFSSCESPGMPVPGLAEGLPGLNRSIPPQEPGRIGSSPEPGTFWLASAACFAALIAVGLHRPRHLRR